MGDSKSKCYICKMDKKTEEVFTAECSHNFHYICIAYNLQNANGERTCRSCYATWTRVPPPLTSAIHDSNYYIITRSNSYRNINDDESLLSSEPPSPAQNSTAMSMPMTIKVLPEHQALSKSDCSDSFAVLVSIQAPPLCPAVVYVSSTREPLDLVAVLDVSGSMRGQKIALLKQAVNFVIKNLGPLDRLSIITFSSTSHRLTPLKRMTQAGQAETLRAVDSIQADGSTNIIAGLKNARKVLALRREMNPDSSIILLSDGHDTENPFIMSSLIQNALSNSLTARAPRYEIPVYTFGFGSDHDAIALHAISDGSGGSFSYIEAIEVIQDAFAQSLGGLLSVVAQEVEIQVHSGCPEVKIKSIPSGRYKNTIDRFNSQHGVIYVGDVYADEEKQFLVYLSVPQVKDKDETLTTNLLQVKCSHKSPLSNEKIESNTARAEIRRPLKEELSEEDKWVCLEVDREKNRILTAQGIAEAKKMAERGELDGARTMLEIKRRSVGQSDAEEVEDGATMSLFGQAGMVAQCMSSSHTYVGGGRTLAFSAQRSHQYQRAAAQMLLPAGHSTVFGAALTSGAPSGNESGFQTSFMQQMVTKSQQERQASDQNQGTDH